MCGDPTTRVDLHGRAVTSSPRGSEGTPPLRQEIRRLGDLDDSEAAEFNRSLQGDSGQGQEDSWRLDERLERGQEPHPIVRGLLPRALHQDGETRPEGRDLQGAGHQVVPEGGRPVGAGGASEHRGDHRHRWRCCQRRDEDKNQVGLESMLLSLVFFFTALLTMQISYIL